MKVKLPVEVRWTEDYQRRLNSALENTLNALVDSSDQRLVTTQHAAAKATRTVIAPIVSGTVTLDARVSNVFHIDMTENVVLAEPASPLAGHVIKVRFKQDATGGRTITWPANFRWVLGVDPTLSTAANAVDVAYLGYDEIDEVWEGSFLPDFTGTGTGNGQFAIGPEGPQGPQGIQGEPGIDGITLGGTEGQVLTKLSAVDGDADWQTPRYVPLAGAINQILAKASAADNDTAWIDPPSTSPTTTAGDLIKRGASADERLAIGTEGHVLTVVSGAPAWAAASGGGAVATDAIWDAAGDLAVGSGANTAARLAVGTEGQVLTVVSGAPAWADAAAGGGGAGGAMQFVDEASVTGSAATTLTVSGLDLTSDEIYEIECVLDNALGSTNATEVLFNGDTTDANYWRHRVSADSTTLGSSRNNNNTIITLNAGEQLHLRFRLSKNFDGIIQGEYRFAAGTGSTFREMHGWISHTGTNLTSFAITGTASGLSVGSRIRVWKITTPTSVGQTQTKLQASTLSVTSNTTLQNTSLVSDSLVPGTYAVEFTITFTSHATPDTKLRINFTGTTTSAKGNYIRARAYAAVGGEIITALPYDVTATTTDTTTWVGSMVVVVSATGVLSFQIAQNTSSATAVSFDAGGVMRVTRIA